MEAEEAKRAAMISVGVLTKESAFLSRKFELAVRELDYSDARTEKLQLELEEETLHKQELLATRAIEAESLLLTFYLAKTSSEHGLGPNNCMTFLRAKGIVHKRRTKGCNNTWENRVCQDRLTKGWVDYTVTKFDKTRKVNSDAPAVPILDRHLVALRHASTVML